MIIHIMHLAHDGADLDSEQHKMLAEAIKRPSASGDVAVRALYDFLAQRSQ